MNKRHFISPQYTEVVKEIHAMGVWGSHGVNMKSIIFLNEILCILINKYQTLRHTYCLRLKGITKTLALSPKDMLDETIMISYQDSNTYYNLTWLQKKLWPGIPEVYIVLLKVMGLPLWSSAQSSWLQMQRPGFDSRHYQSFWEVVGLEQVPLSLVSTTEELHDRKSWDSSLEWKEDGCRDPSHDHMAHSKCKR
jgi:hypothetical protein